MAASLTPGREARDRPRLRRGSAAFQLLFVLACVGFCYAPGSWAQGRLEIVVLRQRSYWLDEGVATLDQTYELVYHALSDRYLVRNVNSGEQVSYATLDAALDSLRVISNLPILDQALVRPERRHEISVRASLDVRTMPDTLRFILFWSDDWRQRSEWYTWSPRL